MALELTENLKQQISRPDVMPTMVAVIDGLPTIFGNVSIKEYVRIGDPGLVIGDDWYIGGFRLLDDQSPYIQFATGTTTKITQKLDPSRGQGSSVSSMTINLVDFEQEITRIASPGFVLSDVLGRRVTVFLGAQEASFPDDYNVIFRGVVSDVGGGAGFVSLVLNNTDEKKRITVLPELAARSSAPLHFRSATFQDLFFQNRDDVTNAVTVSYVVGGTAGSEVVSLTGPYSIQVQIESGVSTASQVKKSLENSALSNQIIAVKITGNSGNAQVVGSASLGIGSTIDLVDATGFLSPADSGTLRTFVQIGEELLEYTGVSGNQLTGVARAQNGTVGAFHDANSEVRQVVKLSGNGIDLSLKLMLSRGPTNFASGVSIHSIVYFNPTTSQANTLFFDDIDVETEHGVSEGDYCTVSGAGIGGNNVVENRVIEVGKILGGSFVVLEGPLVSEPTTSATAQFKSQYNTLPIGMGMLPVEVDVKQHQFIRDTYLPTFSYGLFERGIEDGKTFLEKEIYLPMTCFSVPRKGRSSAVYTVGPLPTTEVVELNLETVTNPQNLIVKRSTNENFHNSVLFQYDFDPVDSKFTKTLEKNSESSTVVADKKQFAILSKGLRTDEQAATLADRAGRRWLRRYESGAEYIKGIGVIFSRGYQMEIGDIVAVNMADLKLSDFSTGTRAGGIKLMEILNKIIDTKTGEVSIDVVNTSFGFGDRYGLISPSTKLLSGSTTTKLIMEKSWGTRAFEPESKKWRDYVGQNVIVHSPDWTTVYSTTILGFDNNNPQGMSIAAIPAPPGDGWIIQAVDYPNSTDQTEEAYWKNRHAFFSPQVQVVSSSGIDEFTVSPLDVAKFFVGSIVRVHNYDYSDDSPELRVVEISGNDIILSGSMGFTPDTTHFVDLIGFPDNQQAYRIT